MIFSPESGYKFTIEIQKACSSSNEAIWKLLFDLYKKIDGEFEEVVSVEFVAGDPNDIKKVAAITENGILKVSASAKLLDQDRTLEATVDLRDRDYPIKAAIEFTDADIGPYLGLVAPELSGISGKATGTVTLSGPLQDTDRIQAEIIFLVAAEGRPTRWQDAKKR